MIKSFLSHIVITWLSTEKGGAEESVRTLCTALSTMYNVELSLIVWKYHGQEQTYIPSDINFHYYECDAYETYVECLSRCLDKKNTGTILFGNHRTFLTDCREAQQRKIKCVIVFRGIALHNGNIRTLLDGHSKLSYVAMSSDHWQNLRRVDAIIGISNASVASLKKLLPAYDNIFLIYNGLKDIFFSVQHIKVRVQRFLIASRLVDWKELELGIEAFLTLAKDNSDISLTVIGDGPMRDKLEQLPQKLNMEHRIYFAGWQDDPTKWYRGCDCLLHSCSVEGFGRVIVEAQSCGLICVVPQSGGAADLVLNGHTGLTFEPGNMQSCYEALKLLVKWDASIQRRIREGAFVRAKNLFNQSRMAEDYFGIANYLFHYSL